MAREDPPCGLEAITLEWEEVLRADFCPRKNAGLVFSQKMALRRRGEGS